MIKLTKHKPDEIDPDTIVYIAEDVDELIKHSYNSSYPTPSLKTLRPNHANPNGFVYMASCNCNTLYERSTKMNVKGNHPLAEILAKALFGIESVPKEYQKRMVNRAIKEAVAFYEQTRTPITQQTLCGSGNDTPKVPDFHELHAMLWKWREHELTTLEVLEKIKTGKFDTPIIPIGNL